MEEGAQPCQHRKRPRMSDNDSVGESEQEETGLSAETSMDLQVLDCPICLEPLSSPVFQCQNGHIACSQCCNMIEKKCPSCRLIIGDIRCLAIERVIESVKVSCGNKPFGCKKTVLYMQKQKHEKTCGYAPYRCPISVCGFQGTSTQLCLHFSRLHPSSAKCFKYNQPFTVSFDLMEPYRLFQEEEDARLFVLSNQMEILGNAITLACLGSCTFNVGFGYELRSRQKGCSLKLKSETEFVKDQKEAIPVKGFLLVPSDLCSGRVELEILIQKRDYAFRSC